MLASFAGRKPFSGRKRQDLARLHVRSDRPRRGAACGTAVRRAAARPSRRLRGGAAMSDAGDPFDRRVEAPYEPPAWVKEWDGRARRADGARRGGRRPRCRSAVLVEGGGVRGRPLRRFQHGGVTASGTSSPLKCLGRGEQTTAEAERRSCVVSTCRIPTPRRASLRQRKHANRTLARGTGDEHARAASRARERAWAAPDEAERARVPLLLSDLRRQPACLDLTGHRARRRRVLPSVRR